MAAGKTDLIDSVVSSQAFKDLENLNALLAKSVDSFTSAAANAMAFKDSLGKSGGLVEYQKNAKGAKEALSELDKIQEQIRKTQEKQVAAQSDLAKQLAQEKILLQQTNKENANRAKIAETVAGSLSRYDAVIAKLQAKQRALNLTTDEGREKSEKYKKAIENLNNARKAESDVIKQQQLNVGNYQGSAKIIVDALQTEIKKLDELKKKRIEVQGLAAAQPYNNNGGLGSAANTPSITASTGNRPNPVIGFSRGNQSLQQFDAEIEAAEKRVEALQKVTEKPSFLNLASKIGDSKKELKGLITLMLDLENAGLKNTDQYKQAKLRAAELKDQIADINDEVKALSSDTRGFDLFAGSVSFLADAFQTAAAGVVLFGGSEEDAAEATKALVAIQSISNGVKGIANELTTKGTAANRVFAFSQLQIKTAFDATATSAARLRAALITVGIGALIVGVGLLIANFDKLKRAITGVSKEKELLNKALDEGTESAKEEITALGSLYQTTQNLNLSIKDRTEAAKKLQETYPTTFGNLTTEAILVGDAAGAYDLLTQSILDKYKAEAVGKLLGEKSFERLKEETRLRKKLAEEENEANRIRSSNLSENDSATRQDGGDGKSINTTTTGKKGLLEASKKRIDAINSEIAANEAKFKSDNQFLLAEESKLRKGAELAKQNEEQRKKNKEVAKDAEKNRAKIDQDAKAREEKRIAAAKKADEDAKQRLEAKAEKENKFNEDSYNFTKQFMQNKLSLIESELENENLSYEKRVEKLKEFQTIKEQLALVDFANSVRDTKKVEDGKLIAVKKSNAEKETALLVYNDAILKITNDSNKALNDAYLTDVENKKKAEKDKFDAAIQQLNATKSDVDLRRAKEKNDALNKLRSEDYDAEAAKIEKDFALKAAADKIQELQGKLSLAQFYDQKQEYLDIEKELAYAQIDLSALVRDKKINDEQKVLDNKKKLKDLENQLLTESKQLVIDIVNGQFEAEKNKVQESINLAEDNKAKQIEAVNEQVNQNVITQEEGAAKIKIIEAIAQSEKEKLVRKQKEIAYEQAVFERALAIGSIIVNTAQASIAALLPPPKGFGPVAGIPFSISTAALGAIQIASILAKPIPRYKDGLDLAESDHLAITGDGYKHEIIKRKDGSMELSPNKPTYTFIRKGDSVISGKETEKYLQSMAGVNQLRGGSVTYSTVNFDFETALQKHSSAMISALEKNKTTVNVTNTGRGISANTRTNAGYTDFINKKVYHRK